MLLLTTDDLAGAAIYCRFSLGERCLRCSCHLESLSAPSRFPVRPPRKLCAVGDCGGGIAPILSYGGGDATAACVTYQAVYLVIVKVSSIPTFRISSVIGTSRSVEMGTLPEERRHIVLVVQSSSSGTCNGLLLSHPL